MNCEICGGGNAYFVCTQCNRRVCSNCYDSELDSCNICARDRNLAAESALRIFNLNSGKLFLSGIGLILVGIFLMMVATILSAPSEGGVVVIFPFIFWRVGETAALIAMVLFMILSLIMVLLPWLLGSKKMLKVIQRISGIQTERPMLRKIEKMKKGESEDYLISFRMPGFKEDDIEIKVFADTLEIRATKDGEVFIKTCELPKSFKPENIRYRYRDGFLLIRVSLKRVKRT